MIRSALPLSSILLALFLAGSSPEPGLARQADAAESVRESKVDDLEAAITAAIDAATDKRGAPTPEQFGLRVELARHLLEQDREDDAVAQLRIAAELGALDQDLALLLAELERRDGRDAAAARQYRSISERFDSSLAEVRLAELALERGREKVALDHAARAVELAETGADRKRALELHWRTARRIGSAGEAMDSLRRLAELAPDDPRPLWSMGEILAARGRHAEAVEALLQARDLADAADESLPALDRDLGLALVAEDRYEEARTYLESFLRASPGRLEADAEAALAQVEERLGESEAAAARARRVLDAESDHAGALLVTGRLHAASGDFAAARRALELALVTDPASAKTHYQLSLACARLGDRECAERHLWRYQELQDAPEDIVEMTKQ